ncbi:hypothetical protein [Roseovarius sp. E0-M6]|uniref:hypothetical protein n=1 Tax=Roseovarius sp. E0-M6 TaxID=3127118 RepID=UPI00300FF398
MIKYIALTLGMSLMAHSAIALSEGVIEIDTNGDGVIGDSEMVAAQDRGLIPSSPGG